MARRSLIARALVASALLAPALGVGILATPAHAAPRVTIANANGEAVADPKYGTSVQLKGSGFQSVKKGFGGIYVGFGTVKGNWKPSKGGKTGTDYWYVPDSEEQANQGLFKFISYPGSDTSSAANGGTVKADGSWSTSLTIPGASFQALDRSGNVTTIDCLKVRCGIITFGAHGLKNGANESFTPIKFKDMYAAGSTPSATGGPDQNANSGPTADDTELGGDAVSQPDASQAETKKAKKAAAVPDGSKAAVQVDRLTAFAGRVMTFTGTGFVPGEQVAVSFDDGMAAVGPLAAGSKGEVAGVIQIPVGTKQGTHSLKVTGAASQASPTVSFAVGVDAAAAEAEDESTSERLAIAFLVVALLVFIAATAVVILRRVKTKKAARSQVISG